MNPKFLRVAAAVVTAIGSAAGVIAANPDLVKTSLPPSVAAAVLTAAMVIVTVLHELAHNTAPAATAPADPAPKESP